MYHLNIYLENSKFFPLYNLVQNKIGFMMYNLVNNTPDIARCKEDLHSITMKEVRDQLGEVTTDQHT